MEREAKEALILRLFRAYPGGENKVSRATVDTYLKAVDFFPLRYIDIAIDQFANAQVERDARSRPFAPSTDEFCAHIRKVRFDESKHDRMKRDGMLQLSQRDHDAEVEASRTPGAMARVRSMMEGFAESVAPTQKTPAEIAKAKADLGRLDAKFQGDFEERIPGIKVSSYLIKSLGYETYDSAETDHMDIGEDR